MVDIGSIYICLEVSMMSSHIEITLEVNMEQLHHVFVYLNKYHNSELVLDPGDQVIDQADF